MICARRERENETETKGISYEIYAHINIQQPRKILKGFYSEDCGENTYTPLQCESITTTDRIEKKKFMPSECVTDAECPFQFNSTKIYTHTQTLCSTVFFLWLSHSKLIQFVWSVCKEHFFFFSQCICSATRETIFHHSTVRSCFFLLRLPFFIRYTEGLYFNFIYYWIRYLKPSPIYITCMASEWEKRFL